MELSKGTLFPAAELKRAILWTLAWTAWITFYLRSNSTDLHFDLLCFSGLLLLSFQIRENLSRIKVCTILSLFGLFLILSISYGRRVAGIGTSAFVLQSLFHYCLLHYFAKRPGNSSLIPVLFPVLAMIFLKTLLPSGHFMLFGLSYTAFRLSSLSIEVRNEEVPFPSPWQYLFYAVFFPLFWVGPITKYRSFLSSSEQRLSTSLPLALERFVIGYVKFGFLGTYLNQLSFDGLMIDYNSHAVFDLLIASFAYYLYIYCNFSGMCDMVIAACYFMGLRVDENFDNPFLARNIKEFWNRWHMTLSRFLRDTIFTPFVKAFSQRFGMQHQNLAIVLGSSFVFLGIGLWHGAQWNYVLFALIHIIGFAINYYYTLSLKKHLGAKRFKSYGDNPLVKAIAMASTFVFVAVSFIFFANPVWKMKEIFSTITQSDITYHLKTNYK